MTITSEKIKEIKIFSNNIRSNILEMAFTAGSNSSHFGGALSLVEIISTLFSYQMNIDNKNPEWPDRDRFILSKGHACLAYYAALCEVGYLTLNDLKTFEKDGSILSGHPVKNIKHGIEFSTGSLGIGLSIGLGLALASKRKKKKNKIYVVIGDGECNEGSIWESALSAPNLELNNLFVIIDKNNFQQTGSTKEIMETDNLSEKWKSFGWEVNEVDGHSIEKLIEYFSKNSKSQKPNLLIANTIKGKGFSFAENNNNWHHAVLTKAMYEQAKEELKKFNDN